VNCDTPVVLYDSKYYACTDGAWYESDSSKGPWIVCSRVPEAIYSIPPDSPIYNTTYVKVYDYDEDDDTVDVGYTPGYLGSYVYGGCVLFGTGWLYHCWRKHHPVHIQPIWTYGHGCRYNRILGCWNRYARFRTAAGKYVAWQSKFRGNVPKRPLPPMAPGRYQGRQPRTAVLNAYARNKAALKTAALQRGEYRKIAAKKQVASAALKKRSPNNVYVSKDGSIYRHTLNGWQKRDKGSWSSMSASQKMAAAKKIQNKKQSLQRPSNTVKPHYKPKKPVSRPQVNPRQAFAVKRELNNYYKSRQRGSYRTSTYRRSRSSSSRRSYSARRSSVRRSAPARRGGGRRR